MTNIAVKQINLTEHFEQLLAIWCACFPEDADFGETFLRQTAPFAEIFGVFENESLVSCAYCLPCVFHNQSEQFSAMYVYGVGTLPTHRGKGYAKRLLEHIKDAVFADLLFLYPAKPSLRAFYEGLGYRAVLYRSEHIVSHEINDIIPAFDVIPFDAVVYAAKRAAFVQKEAVSHAVFDTTVLQTLLQHAQMLLCEEGIALCMVDEQTVYVPELLCDKVRIPVLLAAVKQHFQNKRVVAYTAGAETASGLLLPCNKQAEEHFENQKNIPFFGTFFAE